MQISLCNKLDFLFKADDILLMPAHNLLNYKTLHLYRVIALLLLSVNLN